LAKKKWQRFENLVAQIQRTLTPQSKVTQNDRIQGRQTKGLRQIDISIRHKVGQYEILIVMDCKDYKRPIDVKCVEEFMGLVDDVGANKGALVSASGFTNTAKTRAKDAGIDLYRLIDAEKHEWQTFVSIPVLCDFRRIKSFNFVFSGSIPSGINEFRQGFDLRRLVIYDQKGSPIDTLGNLLARRWNNNFLPKEPGTHQNNKLIDYKTFINVEHVLFEVEITTNIIVEKNLYFGQLSLSEIKGFEDQIGGGVVTRSFTTDFLNFAEVEKKWQKVHSEEDLAVTLVLSLTASDYIPLTKFEKKT